MSIAIRNPANAARFQQPLHRSRLFGIKQFAQIFEAQGHEVLTIYPISTRETPDCA